MSTAVSLPAPGKVRSAAGERAGFLVLLAIGLLIGLRVVATVSALPAGEHRRTGVHAFADDTARYHAIAEAGGVPYRDSAVEFPPVTLGFIEGINGPTVGTTMRNLAWASLALDILAAAALGYGWGRRALLAYLVLGLPFFYLPFIYFRVDLLSVALTAWGIALVKRRRDREGGVVLAIAVFAKLWPLVLLPLLAVERRWNALVAAIGTGLVGGLAWMAVGGTDGIEQVLTFRHATGWQVESVTAGVLRVFVAGRVRLESGAFRWGTAPFWATSLLAMLMLATVAFIWVRAARGPRDAGIDYAVAPIASIGAFMVCSPLLSPQYLVWLLPFAALAWVYGRRLLAGLVCAATVWTMVLTQFLPGVLRGTAGSAAVLDGRNALLIGMVVYAIVLVARHGHTEHAAPGTRPASARRGCSESVIDDVDPRPCRGGASEMSAAQAVSH
jgi:hypothetical protein